MKNIVFNTQIFIPGENYSSDCKSSFHNREIFSCPAFYYMLDAAEQAGSKTTQMQAVSENKIPGDLTNGEKDKAVLGILGFLPLITADEIEKLVRTHMVSDNDVTVCMQNGCGICLMNYSVAKEISGTELEGEFNKAFFDVVLGNSSFKTAILEPYDLENFMTVTNMAELAYATKILMQRINRKFMLSGVTMINPDHTYISPKTKFGLDVVVYPGVFIEGETEIGDNCVIGANTTLSNMKVGKDVNIECSVLHESEIGDGTHVGPFAYVRPGCVVGKNVKIGDFVEIKNAVIADGSKASHLTYIGDADVGSGVNFGCGTVTVNYDGKKKHRTVIGNNAFIGCNTNLVAPVKVKDGAYIAAGSTITDEVPENSLAIARARQVVKTDWKDKRK